MVHIEYLSAVAYGIGALAYAVLALQLALRGWPSQRGRLLLAACLASVGWELAGLVLGVWPDRLNWRIYQLADALRWGAWIGFLASLLGNKLGSLPKWAGVALVPAATLVLGMVPMLDSMDPPENANMRRVSVDKFEVVIDKQPS
jgi:hypothetical protein